MIRVLVNGRFLGQRTTGVQRHARELLRAVDAVLSTNPSIRARFSFELLVPPGTQPDLTFGAIPVREVGSWHGQLWEQLDLWRHARGAMLLNLCNTAPIAAGEMIATIHDASVYAVPAAYSASFRTWYRMLLPTLGKRARRIVTVSEFSRDELARYAGIPPGRITVIQGGGDHILAQPADYAIIRRLGLQPRGYVLAVGSYSAHKNLAAVAEAARRFSTHPVVVAGGINTEVFRARPNLKYTHVHVAGYVTDAELRALYEQAACLLYPSLYEGFGLPPLEAMTARCPVVVSRAASLPEVCGEAAIYCDPTNAADIAQAVERVVNDIRLQDDLRDRGAERARHFSWAAAAHSMLALLEELH